MKSFLCVLVFSIILVGCDFPSGSTSTDGSENGPAKSFKPGPMYCYWSVEKGYSTIRFEFSNTKVTYLSGLFSFTADYSVEGNYLYVEQSGQLPGFRMTVIDSETLSFDNSLSFIPLSGVYKACHSK